MYIAKLAVLICIPRKNITHCPLSLTPLGPGMLGEWSELERQGVVRSDSRTPFSRASCSSVMGMNEAEDC